jgi:hypothetical protein
VGGEREARPPRLRAEDARPRRGRWSSCTTCWPSRSRSPPRSGGSSTGRWCRIRSPGRAAPVTRTAPPAEELDKQAVEAIVEEKLRKQKVLAGWKDGFFLESPSGDFKLKLRGYIQTQPRIFTNENDDTGTDSIFMRRVRPIVEGTVFKYFDYKIMPDFGQGTTSLQDA